VCQGVCPEPAAKMARLSYPLLYTALARASRCRERRRPRWRKSQEQQPRGANGGRTGAQHKADESKSAPAARKVLNAVRLGLWNTWSVKETWRKKKKRQGVSVVFRECLRCFPVAVSGLRHHFTTRRISRKANLAEHLLPSHLCGCRCPLHPLSLAFPSSQTPVCRPGCAAPCWAGLPASAFR